MIFQNDLMSTIFLNFIITHLHKLFMVLIVVLLQTSINAAVKMEDQALMVDLLNVLTLKP